MIANRPNWMRVSTEDTKLYVAGVFSERRWCRKWISKTAHGGVSFISVNTPECQGEGRFVVHPASAESFGNLTMAHPELLSEHIAGFMRSLGDEASQRF